MSLYDSIIDMYQRAGDEWNYYDCNMSFPFSYIEAKRFIEQYFEQGAKKNVILPMIDEIDCMRSMHTISVFFIGLLLKRNMGQNLNIRSLDSENYEFSYLWFLVCLYHDMGYAVENDWMYKFVYRKQSAEFLKKYPSIRKSSWHLRNAYEDLGLVFVVPQSYRGYSFFRLSMDVHRQNYKGIVFCNGERVDKAMYSRKTVLNYLEYCKMNEKIRHYDHGIVGGFWLYDSLMKNYYKMYMREKEFNHNTHSEYFYVNGNRYFSKEQHMVFAYLADCIISHNIWPANEETYEIYKKCELNELVEPNFKKISFRDNPILFILAIADTIDPIKLYSDVTNVQEIDIWRGIDMIFERNRVVIKVMDARLSFGRLKNKIKGTENWIDVDVSICSEDKTIVIGYNQLMQI